MKFLREQEQKRLHRESGYNRFIEDLRFKLHDGEDLELDQLLARIDALPGCDIQTPATEIKSSPWKSEFRKRVMAIAAATVLLIAIPVFILSSLPRPPRSVWRSLEPLKISVNSGSKFPSFDDCFLDADQAVIPLDMYPKGISRRLALRMSITGNAEGVSFYVKYRIHRPTKLDHGYDVVTHEEIMEMAEQGYVLCDVFVRR